MSSSPTPYTIGYNFTAFQAADPDTPLPADMLDAEHVLIRTSLNATISRLAEIQRADGALANSSVHPDAFTATALALLGSEGFTPRGAWVTATAYAIGDMVTESSVTYVCPVAHTSGTFATDLAAGKWMTMSAGDVIGPAGGATDGLPAVFSGTTGKVLKVATAAAIRSAIGSTSVGDALYIAASAAAARSAAVAAGTGSTGRADLEIEGYVPRNYVVNGDFVVAQRAILTLAANSLGDTAGATAKIGKVDGWAVYASAGTITGLTGVTQDTAATIGTTGYALHVSTITMTGSAKLCVATRIEAKDAVHLKSKAAVFGATFLHDIGSSKNVTITVSKPSTTADDFSGLTTIATSAALPVADATGTVCSLAISDMGDCSKGIQVLFELDCGAITTKNLRVADAFGVRGTTVPPVFPSQPFEAALARCQRYFAKTFPYTTAPAQAAGVTGALAAKVPVANACVQANWRFPVTMRATPTLVTFSTGDASASWWNSTAGSASANSSASTGDGGVHLSTATGLTVGEQWGIHVAAKAELF